VDPATGTKVIVDLPEAVFQRVRSAHPEAASLAAVVLGKYTLDSLLFDLQKTCDYNKETK